MISKIFPRNAMEHFCKQAPVTNILVEVVCVYI